MLTEAEWAYLFMHSSLAWLPNANFDFIIKQKGVSNRLAFFLMDKYPNLSRSDVDLVLGKTNKKLYLDFRGGMVSANQVVTRVIENETGTKITTLDDLAPQLNMTAPIPKLNKD